MEGISLLQDGIVKSYAVLLFLPQDGFFVRSMYGGVLVFTKAVCRPLIYMRNKNNVQEFVTEGK